MQQLFAAMSDKNQKAFQSHSNVNSEADSGETKQYLPSNSVIDESVEILKSLEQGQAVRKIEPIERVETQPVSDQNMNILRREIDGLKDLLREQTEQLKEPTSSPEMSPQYERLESRLMTLGFSGGLTRKLLKFYDRDDSIDQNWRKIINRFSSALPIPLYEPLAQGGVFAVTGPTGAGKSTTLAKLAAHAVKDYGADTVAVVSLDWYQVGGQEILKSVTNILGVEFYPLSEHDSLENTLASLSKKRLVLIDTSGSAEALVQWRLLMQKKNLANLIHSILVLPTTMHPASINQFIGKSQSTYVGSVILSKLDESACFGGIIEPVLKNRWPIWYCTTGQEIPQDIEFAEAKNLTRRLIKALTNEASAVAVAS